MIARRLAVVAVSGLALVALAAPARAQGIGLGASVGANVPNGKFADNATTGLVANGLVDLRFNDHVGIRGELFWSRSDLDNAFIRKVGNATLPSGGVGTVDGNIDMIGGIGNLVLAFGPKAVQPYLIGGVGVYRQRVAQNMSGTIDEFRHIRTSEHAVGYNGGAGIRFHVLGVSPFVEARYHSVDMKDNGGKVKFVPVMVGLSF
jgi:hypothetical protein